MEIKDSGKRESFSTGAVRDTQEGKGRYDLLPAYAIQRLAQHFENGAKKYDDENWRKGIPLRRFLDSALRHTFKFLEGNRDEDHAAAAAWNLLALIETQEMIRRGSLPESLDNLPDFTGPKTFLEVPLSALDQLDGTPAPAVDPAPGMVYFKYADGGARWTLKGDRPKTQMHNATCAAGPGECWMDSVDYPTRAKFLAAVASGELRPDVIPGPDLDKCGTVDGVTPIPSEPTPPAPSPYDGDWNSADQTLSFWRVTGGEIRYIDSGGGEVCYGGRRSVYDLAHVKSQVDSGKWVRNVQGVAMTYPGNGYIQWRLDGGTPMLLSQEGNVQSLDYPTKEAFLTAIAEGKLVPA